jgi:aryl-alcohol dehydrogenase-like predicted oxidoreductase
MQFGWTADEETSFSILTTAVEAGINFIDTADIYSRWVEGNPGGVSETILGKWLARGVISRDQLVIATKVRGRMGDGPNDEGLSRLHIEQAVEASLRRLKIDTIDLYQVHWPDDNTPLEETLGALHDLVRRGLVRYIGCSNFPAWLLVRSLWVSQERNLERFVCLQPHYNMIHRMEYERELEKVCEDFGLGVIPYSPLGGGFLTGKYVQGTKPPEGSRGAISSRIQTYMSDERVWVLLEELRKLGEAYNATMSQIALAWLLQRPSITSPIIGPRTIDQLNDNLGALAFRMSSADLGKVEEISIKA